MHRIRLRVLQKAPVLPAPRPWRLVAATTAQQLKRLASGKASIPAPPNKPVAVVRGMHDALPEEAEKRDALEIVFRQTAQCFGFRAIQTPVVEETRLFARSLGDTSDVVMKEMYAVSAGASAGAAAGLSGSGSSALAPGPTEHLALRPEGTAGAMRALLNSGTIRLPKASQPIADGSPTLSLPIQPTQRLFYCGPMFRHERPQKGRFRQFSQLGVEMVGGLGDAAADVEVLSMAHTFLQRALAGSGIRVTLLLNSLGDAHSMKAYSAALHEHFTIAHAAGQRAGGGAPVLSPLSLARLERGAPLRILDSKDAGDQAIAASAPEIDACWTPSAAARFAAVQEGLAALGIPFERAPRLVRGLDYYRHTIFEFVASASASASPSDPAPTPLPSSVLPATTPARVDGGGSKHAGSMWGPIGVDGSDSPAASSTAAAETSPLGTLLAGGRYDGLAAIIGSGSGSSAAFGDVPAVGWAAGLDRLCILSTIQPAKPFTVAVLPVVPKEVAPAAHAAAASACSAIFGSSSSATAADAAANAATSSDTAVGRAVSVAAARVAAAARASGHCVVLLDRAPDVRKAVTAASKLGAGAAVIVGEDELSSRCVTVKDMRDGSQAKLASLEEVVQRLDAARQAAAAAAAAPMQ